LLPMRRRNVMLATRSKKRMISSSANIEDKTSARASPLGARCQKANAGARWRACRDIGSCVVMGLTRRRKKRRAQFWESPGCGIRLYSAHCEYIYLGRQVVNIHAVSAYITGNRSHNICDSSRVLLWGAKAFSPLDRTGLAMRSLRRW
jgi:hypothetical protein